MFQATASAAPQTYDPTSASNVWDVSTVNWDGSTAAWTNGNSALFSGTGESVAVSSGVSVAGLTFGSGDYILTGPLIFGSNAVAVTNAADTATLTGVLSGSAGLQKTGAGTLVIAPPTGAGNASTYTGNTEISAGILAISGSVTQKFLGTDTVFSGTNGVAGGTNQVIVSSGATLKVSGASTRLELKEIHLSGTGVTGAATPGGFTSLGALYLDATGSASGQRIGHNSAGNNAAIVLDADTTIRVDGSAAAITGTGVSASLIGRTILNGNTLTKTGIGSIGWEVAAGSIYGSGTIHVKEGLIRSNQANTFGNTVNVIVDAGASAWNTVGGAAFNATSNTVTMNGTMVVNARGNGTAGSDTTNDNLSVGVLNGTSTGVITSGLWGNTGTNTLAVSHATADSSFSGTIGQTNGTLGIIKNGAATLSLGGANTYSGTTAVNAGRLNVNGTHTGGAAYTVAAAGTLGGTGSIVTTVNMNGSLSPGLSSGTLTVSDLNMLSNSTYAFEGGDLTKVTGQLSLASVWTLTLGGGFMDGGTVTLFDFGTLAASPGLSPAINMAGLGFAPSGSLSVTQSGNKIVLNGISTVPEPGSLLMLVATALGLSARRRRR